MCLQKIVFNRAIQRSLKLSKTLRTSRPDRSVVHMEFRPFSQNTTTFVRQNISKSEQMIDEFFKNNPECTNRFEFLSTKLFKKMKSTGKNYVSTAEVSNLQKITGLTEQELAQNFDNIASFFTGLKEGATSVFYTDMPFRLNVKIGQSMAQITPIGKGCSGTVYQIKFPNSNKKYVLKKYHGNEFDISRLEGAYQEAALQQRMTIEGVDDIAKLAISNPENGWIVSEFVDGTYSATNKGLSLEKFMKKYNLQFEDVNGGMYLKDANGKNILVDFGYISHNDGISLDKTDFLNKLRLQISNDRTILNFDKVLKRYMDNPTERFKIIQQLEVNADNDFCKMFYAKVKDTPQMQLYTKYSKYMCYNMGQKECEITMNELENLMRECGFYSHADEFIGLQNFYNINATRFDDFLSPLFNDAVKTL